MARLGFRFGVRKAFGRWVARGAPLVLAVSCGGVSMQRDSDDRAGAGGSDAGAGGSGGNAGTSAGGFPGKGAASGTTGNGGFSGKGGRGGKGGFAGKGGTTGVGGTSGNDDPGGFGPGGFGPGGNSGECRFEPIGNGRRCENAGSRVQDDTSLLVLSATTLDQCATACLERDDCTAITDYFSESGLDRCYLVHATCDTVDIPTYAEEDAGKEYRKVCDTVGECSMQYLGDWRRCPDTVNDEYVPADGPAECFDRCLASSTCSSVVDYFWIRQIRGCYLYVSTCENPEPLPFGDPGVTYRKVCD